MWFNCRKEKNWWLKWSLMKRGLATNVNNVCKSCLPNSWRSRSVCVCVCVCVHTFMCMGVGGRGGGGGLFSATLSSVHSADRQMGEGGCWCSAIDSSQWNKTMTHAALMSPSFHHSGGKGIGRGHPHPSMHINMSTQTETWTERERDISPAPKHPPMCTHPTLIHQIHHMWVHAYTHACMHAHTHIQTHIQSAHARTHARTHTHTHTHFLKLPEYFLTL